MTASPIKDTQPAWTIWAGIAACLVFLAFNYVSYAPSIFAAWQREEYSHGILIPVIALLMAMNIVKERTPQSGPSLHGLWLIAGGYALFAIAELSAFEPPAHYGFLIVITGILWTVLGGRFVKTILPALAYLAFAIPLPKLIEVALTAKLQLVSSTLGVVILQTLGFSVYQDGNIIDLGVEKIQVVEACSGLRYMFPLMSFSFLLAFLFKAPLWKRAVIFLSAIPITIFMNALRIALIGILVNRWGPKMAEGLIHDMEGWAVFILCIGVLMAEIWVFIRLGSGKDHLRLDYLTLPGKDGVPAITQGAGKTALAAIVASVLFTGLLWGVDLRNREEIIPQRQSFFSFPLALGEWEGHYERMDPIVLQSLHLTDYWNANYKRTPEENPVNLYIAYYDNQRRGTAAHSPANCVPAGGWAVETQEVSPVALPSMTLPVTRMLIRKDNVSMLVYYWFDQRGRIINGQVGAKWYLFVDSITKRRTDGAVIRLVTMVDEPTDVAKADAKIQAFIREFYPSIETYIPE